MNTPHTPNNYFYVSENKLYLSSFHYPLVQRIVHGFDNYIHNRNVYVYKYENKLYSCCNRYSLVHKVSS